MYFRLAEMQDLEEIFTIVKSAVKNMEANGIYQWDELYPTRKDFANDIEKKQLFIGLKNQIIAVIYVINEECDADYRNGAWEYPDDEYCVIHRLCVNPEFQHQGIGKITLEYAEKQMIDRGYQSVRLDAYSNNPFALKLYSKAFYKNVGYAEWRKGRFFLMEKRVI
ncbi:GNAT family N-acetyltransferase [Anaerocolumna sp. MB42-C2]|uniref:GNAT family N-acetyltransferase n=1 Tax=Anaerocolumna sp. MB42-C2 TaxID=3070997 RepID=UPI0027E01652|nr:GNAT family N-acetyltransferase [Anaerocolumna sp. MB42-C2]WMJ89363.1 GNAT family N-acetyltransferase [Anaerocolumna sp. MB42-C2]